MPWTVLLMQSCLLIYFLLHVRIYFLLHVRKEQLVYYFEQKVESLHCTNSLTISFNNYP
uniref:Uncharacterized protein n=1 Tax=Arundo donax TaxID=35708 RepID=A0A0A9AF18_ARUDO